MDKQNYLKLLVELHVNFILYINIYASYSIQSNKESLSLSTHTHTHTHTLPLDLALLPFSIV